MPPFFRARLRYLRNRVDDRRLLREMDVVLRAYHWRATVATSEKAAVARCWDCGHFSAPHRGVSERARQKYGTPRRCFSSFKAIWSPDHLCCPCASFWQCGRGQLIYLHEPLALPNCWLS